MWFSYFVGVCSRCFRSRMFYSSVIGSRDSHFVLRMCSSLSRLLLSRFLIGRRILVRILCSVLLVQIVC